MTALDQPLAHTYADPPRADAYRLAWTALRLRGLELHLYAESEAAGLRPTIDRMIEDALRLV